MRCLLVCPAFRAASFWNYGETCRIAGARYPAAPLGLITVAAMLPTDWEVRLVDRNVDAWNDDLLDWPDLVMVGGMLPQQPDALEVIRLAQKRGKTTVMGGPDVTSSPHVYAEADHRVLGEAEVTLAPFLADLAAGNPKPIYESEEKADVTRSPCPRFDLLNFEHYLHIGVQWCRGCPFSCEFCDIIELYGRRPRAKTTEQMLHEFQTLYDLGYRGWVDLVDDNFIGNKKLVKQFLPHLRDWCTERDWPFTFSTEASLNLADDDELLLLMQEVGFFSIFVGIESPDEATLIATGKRQNTRRSIVESVQRIQSYGIWLNAGYIIGFDAESGRVAAGIIECIRETNIPVNMVGLLYALPNTQLTRRLAEEGRLPEDWDVVPEGAGDQCTTGLNFDTCRPREEILGDFLEVVETVYAPKAYFGRVRRMVLALDVTKLHYRLRGSKGIFGLWVFLQLCWRLGMRPSTGLPFWRVVISTLGKNPGAIRQAMSLATLYLHYGPFARHAAALARDAMEGAVAAGTQQREAAGVTVS